MLDEKLHDREGREILLSGKTITGERVGFEPINSNYGRKVLKRIKQDAYGFYSELGLKNNKPNVHAVDSLYYVILNNVNGTASEGSHELGACYFSYKRFKAETMLEPKRIRWAAKILEANGLIRTRVVRVAEDKTKKYYYPIYAANVTADGYIIDENGVKMKPSVEIYLTEEQRVKPEYKDKLERYYAKQNK